MFPVGVSSLPGSVMTRGPIYFGMWAFSHMRKKIVSAATTELKLLLRNLENVTWKYKRNGQYSHQTIVISLFTVYKNVFTQSKANIQIPFMSPSQDR